MKKIKNLNTILIILIMINYFAFSTFVTEDPGLLNEGAEIAKISSNEFDTLTYHIYDFDTFGRGYAVVSADRIFYNYNLSYFDFNHNLIWSRDLGLDDSNNKHVVGSDEYLAIMNVRGNNKIYDLNGELVSEFSINENTPSYGIEYNITRMLDMPSLISGESLFSVEIFREYFINNTGTVYVVLHSYDIINGDLNWKEPLLRHYYDLSDDANLPAGFVEEFKYIQSSEQLLIIASKPNGIRLNQFNLIYDENNDLDDIIENESRFECVDSCWDDLIFSVDEVVWVSEEVDGDNKTTTFESSNGYELKVVSPYFTLTKYDNRYFDSGIHISNNIHLTEKEMMVSGWMVPNRDEYWPFIGYIISDNDLSLNLFALNDTVILKMISLNENTLLTKIIYKYETKYEMIIWSLNKIKTVKLFNPYYINYLPLILLAVLISNLGYKGYKYTRKDKLESST